MNEKVKTIGLWTLKIIFIPAILLLLYVVWKYRKKLFKRWYPAEELPHVQYGDKGDAVLKLQQALNKCWKNTLKEDGVLGPKTQEVLGKAAYQLPLLKNKFDEVVNKC